jgi:hypothetical protein
MKATKNVDTRHGLLSLITVLLGSGHKKVENFDYQGNLEQLLNQESIQFLCQLCAETHFDPVSSEICTISKDIPALWYTAPPTRKPPALDTIEGPFTVEGLKNMLRSGKIDRMYLVSVCSHNDGDPSDQTEEWHELQDVWQLRRRLLDEESSSSELCPSIVSALSLKSLERLVLVHNSTDYRGIPYFPIPLAKRLICDGNCSCLPIISQCILSQNTDVIHAAVSLIRNLMSYNEVACRKLYLTGIFYFAFVCDSSNWVCVARMIHETHLKQDISFSCRGMTGKAAELPSVLCRMIPDGLIKILINHGPEKFAEVFLGNHDNPEGE